MNPENQIVYRNGKKLKRESIFTLNFPAVSNEQKVYIPGFTRNRTTSIQNIAEEKPPKKEEEEEMPIPDESKTLINEVLYPESTVYSNITPEIEGMIMSEEFSHKEIRELEEISLPAAKIFL